MFGTGEVVGRNIMEYDENGNVIKLLGYDLYEDTFNGYVTYKYNDAGNLIQFNEYDAIGSMYLYHILEKDADANEIVYIYRPEGELVGYSIIEYDENRNLIKESEYNSEKILECYSVYEYDDAGNQISEHYFSIETETKK